MAQTQRQVSLASLCTALTAVTTAVAAAPGKLPTAPAMDPVGSLFQFIVALIVVLLAIVVSALLFRRFGRLSSPLSGSLKSLGGLSLGARERIVLVQVGDQQLLLGVAPGRIQTLHVLAHPVATAAGNTPGYANALPFGTGKAANQFAARLTQFMKHGRQP